MRSQHAPVLTHARASHRLWDLHMTKCRQVLRGHIDSVNESCWQPFGATIATGELLN
jgi:WD40 repeat protein